MTTREATCACGQLRLACDGEPVRVGICHCRACQRRTGSVFSVQARFHRDNVRSSGDCSTWQRTGDDGGRIVSRFCPTCGSTVWFTIDVEPELVGVAVGAFADGSFPAPTYAVYEARAHPWALLRDLPLEHWE